LLAASERNAEERRGAHAAAALLRSHFLEVSGGGASLALVTIAPAALPDAGA
jgi:hypothetical protein